MAQNKTTYTEASVENFIKTADDPQKQMDSIALIKLMATATGEPAKMFGSSIIGFGQYHYKYASGHEGNAPLLGFSPRKSAISLYVYSGGDEQRHLVDQLGKFKIGKACIYIKRLSDINIDILKQLMCETIQFIENTYTRIKE
ncbi:DUF1801 domain-containing protein [Sphingobacterium sp.]|uniref:DUF1801 domain-containing protein n=1 Tax=Sphingobacterium sp. TaxID=341027 RepID=UPI002899A60F|nr:DUF1801 domain-containing protein [Sphingobacterium sp.]